MHESGHKVPPELTHDGRDFWVLLPSTDSNGTTWEPYRRRAARSRAATRGEPRPWIDSARIGLRRQRPWREGTPAGGVERSRPHRPVTSLGQRQPRPSIPPEAERGGAALDVAGNQADAPWTDPASAHEHVVT